MILSVFLADGSALRANIDISDGYFAHYPVKFIGIIGEAYGIGV